MAVPVIVVLEPIQIMTFAAVISTTGIEYTFICLLAEVLPQRPPVEVSVSVAVPEYEEGGDQIAFNVFAEGLKLPPNVPSDHIPPVAPPPTEPPNPMVLPPLQIGVTAAPAFAVGDGFTVTNTELEFSALQAPF